MTMVLPTQVRRASLLAPGGSLRRRLCQLISAALAPLGMVARLQADEEIVDAMSWRTADVLRARVEHLELRLNVVNKVVAEQRLYLRNIAEEAAYNADEEPGMRLTIVRAIAAAATGKAENVDA